MTGREQSADRGARVGAELLTDAEREDHACCMKRHLCKDEHFHERDVMRIVEKRLEALADTFEKRARMSSIDANTERSRRANHRARICDAVMQTWLDARTALRGALGEQGTTSAEAVAGEDESGEMGE